MTPDTPWRAHITAADYERHMAATGQPQANAALLAELFRDRPPAPGAAIHFAGAGTGQVFHYLPATTLETFHVTCTDINREYLNLLSTRLPCATAIDDIESPAPRGPFGLAIVILVLEHVDWRRAVAGLCHSAARVFAIVQQNPEDLLPRPLEGTLAALALHPRPLLDPAALIAEFESHAFALTHTSTREVRDRKIMMAFDLTRP